MQIEISGILKESVYRLDGNGVLVFKTPYQTIQETVYLHYSKR
jgi:hypothetical protein